MTVRLYVGNLPTKQPIEREDLKSLFGEAGELISTPKVPKDKKGNCKGFAFITVATEEAAGEIIEKYDGQDFMGNAIKIERALPRTKTKKSEEEEGQTAATEPTPKPITTNKRSSGGSSKRSRRASSSNNTSTTVETTTVQPDPRWAQELAQLKEILAAQTTNS